MTGHIEGNNKKGQQRRLETSESLLKVKERLEYLSTMVSILYTVIWYLYLQKNQTRMKIVRR